MKLWIDGKPGSSGSAIKATIKEQVANINRKVVSRGTRAVNAIRNTELEILKGQRSGRIYRKPYTRKATYRASAPGEPPARRTGNLRMHWNGQVKSNNSSNGGVTVVAELESQEPYAGCLENGTSKMEARPYVDRIKEKAEPAIKNIYREPYT